MKDGDLAVGEARGDAADGLRRERDFGHEQDRALAARDAFLEQADVDFGFARASDAEHEVLRELAKIAGNRGDCRLLLIGRRGRGRDVPRTGDEAGFHRSLAGGDQMASGDEALERFVGRVARGLGEVGDFDRTRKRREHVERVLLFFVIFARPSSDGARSTSVRSTRPIALRTAAGRIDARVMPIGHA